VEISYELGFELQVVKTSKLYSLDIEPHVILLPPEPELVMSSCTIIADAETLVKTHMAAYDPSHDWFHGSSSRPHSCLVSYKLTFSPQTT
jgi:hypothetical protein